MGKGPMKKPTKAELVLILMALYTDRTITSGHPRLGRIEEILEQYDLNLVGAVEDAKAQPAVDVDFQA